MLQHIELDRVGLHEHEGGIPPPIDWALWEKLMRSEMAIASEGMHTPSDHAEQLYDHNRHWLREYRKADWRRAMLLERYLVKRINACRNHSRGPHQRGRAQMPVPGG